ncbi:MAG TPA: hypothetical protein VGN08_06925 [Solirubrobacteraceae bacterium]|jgi:hypothetical protein
MDRAWVLRLVRYVLPAVIVLAGIVIMATGGESAIEGGASIVGAGLAVYLVNWLFRMGTSGEREREREDEARDYYSRHGRWPG